MKCIKLSSENADFVSVSHHACPDCNGDLIRTPRRAIDHLTNWFTPIHRYRCCRYACLWVGNLRVDS
jgi:hypothetical protein